jgi:hypothetical protein
MFLTWVIVKLNISKKIKLNHWYFNLLNSAYSSQVPSLNFSESTQEDRCGFVALDFFSRLDKVKGN